MVLGQNRGTKNLNSFKSSNNGYGSFKITEGTNTTRIRSILKYSSWRKGGTKPTPNLIRLKWQFGLSFRRGTSLHEDLRTYPEPKHGESIYVVSKRFRKRNRPFISEDSASGSGCGRSSIKGVIEELWCKEARKKGDSRTQAEAYCCGGEGREKPYEAMLYLSYQVH